MQKISKIREERDRWRMLCLNRDKLVKENYAAVMASITLLNSVHRLTPGVLPIMAYTGRLRPRGVPLPCFRSIKGRDFTSSGI